MEIVLILAVIIGFFLWKVRSIKKFKAWLEENNFIIENLIHSMAFDVNNRQIAIRRVKMLGGNVILGVGDVKSISAFNESVGKKTHYYIEINTNNFNDPCIRVKFISSASRDLAYSKIGVLFNLSSY